MIRPEATSEEQFVANESGGGRTATAVRAKMELDERAAAVGRHVAALLDEGGELAASTLDPRLHAGHRDTLETRRIDLAVAFQVGQHECAPVVAGERVDPPMIVGTILVIGGIGLVNLHDNPVALVRRITRRAAT